VAALGALLAPAVEAFRAGGVDARLDAAGEIVVGEAKVCGHAAAQIGDAVVVVGNLIESFDHAAATRVLALPAPARSELARLMRRYVTATPIDPEGFKEAAVAAYASALGRRPEAPAGRLTDHERDALAHLDRLFATAAWRAGPVAGRAGRPVRVVKVRAGVFVVSIDSGDASFVAGVVHGRVERAHLRTAESAGAGSGTTLVGMDLAGAGAVLAASGAHGARLAEALSGIRLAA
jgi:hypothetical protein